MSTKCDLFIDFKFRLAHRATIKKHSITVREVPFTTEDETKENALIYARKALASVYDIYGDIVIVDEVVYTDHTWPTWEDTFSYLS